MAEHITDYFNNLNQRKKEIANINGIINDSNDKLDNTKKYIDELNIEIEKIEKLKDKTEKKRNLMMDSKVKCEQNIILYKEDIDRLNTDDKKYIENIITSGVLDEISLSEFTSILTRYIENDRHNHFLDIFGPHLKDHLKKIELKNNNNDNVHDKRQIKRKSKKRSKKHSKKRR
tara:strand:+ start:2791 stop:3312 length:522 start_codon:yes stop_codon:yes gene_type:complete